MTTDKKAEPISTASEALSMFFDEDFSPHAYLDALFTSTLSAGPNTPRLSKTKLTSVNSLQSLQSKCSNLLAHLDYYTNELTKDLEAKIRYLHSSSSIISYSYDNNNYNNNSNNNSNSNDENGIDKDLYVNNGTTRLENYIDNLSNAIHTLYDDVNMVNSQISELEYNRDESNSDRAILIKLSKLKKIKIKMLSILNIFETAKAITTTSLEDDGDNDNVTDLDKKIAPTTGDNNFKKNSEIVSINLDVFTNSLAILEDTIIDELNKSVQTQTRNDGIIRKIESLIELLPLFKNLGKFYISYNSFVSRLNDQKESYLNKF
ncbi:hypothetical protein PACTADRAFT_18842 [Pachysolen tannophilus NRRL Y-2460]|uniref:Uncharacterized protein n=1 Tax=Pachysolen tannophilus NRRL Y-2460 TaxID=669874 RepID=A0A1E4TNP9_PACTA|nr:hypothetical protein PACTADRAFT_18842 [Pachysolen tannophilus NRRL Y-2460]